MNDEMSSPIDSDVLLAHEPFVRATARAVLRGDPQVDDVVQDTWLAALRDGPVHAGSLRAWLRRVARNGALKVLRGRRRRRRREELGNSRGVPTPHEIVEREEIRRRLLDHVLALGEPSRQALLLRYYEGLPPREVARRLEVPVETVKTRIKRGLDRIRERLDQGHGGDRRKWALALALLLPDEIAAPVRAPSRVLPIAVAGLLAATLLVGILTLGRRALEDDPVPARPAERSPAVIAILEKPEHRAATSAAGDVTSGPSRPASILVRVRNATTGLPVAGATVRAGVVVTTDGQGEAVVPGGAEILDISAPGHVGSRRRVIGTPTSIEVALVPAARHLAGCRLEGRVETTIGTPVAGARVLVERQDIFDDLHEGMTLETETDEAGRFALVVGWGAVLVRASHAEHGEGSATVEFRMFGTQVPRRFHVVVRLGPAPALPVRIRPAGGSYRLQARGLVRWWDAGEGEIDLGTVRDGTPVTLPTGYWRLTLRGMEGDEPVAPDLAVQATERGYRLTRDPPGGGPHDLSKPIDAFAFDVETGSHRIRLTADGRPVPDARLTVELARDADPFVRRDRERAPARGLRGSFITGSRETGKRAWAGHVREATTGPDGIAEIPGWVPAPALVRVCAEGLVERYVEVESWPDDGSPVEIVAVRGAVLDVRLPAWLDGVRTRRLSDDEILFLDRDRLPFTLAPGEYVLRERVWLDRDTETERVLFGPFQARPGARIEVDLTSTEPSQILSIRMSLPNVAGRIMAGRTGGWEADSIVGDGLTQRTLGTFLWTGRKFRYIDTSGVSHEHGGGGRALRESSDIEPGTRIDVDCSYPGSDARLDIVNRSGLGTTVGLYCSDPRAEGVRFHTAVFLVPEHESHRILVRHLPAGTYRVQAGDPEVTVEPETLEVISGSPAHGALTLRRRAVLLRLMPEDPELEPGDLAGGWLQLCPAGDQAAQRRWPGAPVNDHGEAYVTGVPPGRWLARFNYAWDMEFSPMERGTGTIGVSKWVALGAIDVAQGRTERALAVPPKSEARVSPRSSTGD
jgi:RNA polymerase sigma factor (sigma-70 family)